MFGLSRRSQKPKLASSTFQGWVKYVRRDHLNVFGLAAFDCAFPRFLPPVWTEDAKAAALERVDPNVTHVGFQSEQHRRFSGGADLSRASYFSICPSSAGDDGGTLASELRAYRDRADQGISVEAGNGTRGFFMKFGLDAARAEHAENSWVCIRIHPARRLKDQLRSLLNSKSIDVESVNSAIDRPEVLDWLDATNVAVVAIDPALEHRTIENVVDLRLPETRQWFLETFKIGMPIEEVPKTVNENAGAVFCRPFGGNISEFWHMLPELLDPDIGGSGGGGHGITQGIGAWLRLNGADALIYPSARNDSFVAFEDGQMTDFGGWNLVDYRGSTRNLRHGCHISMAPWASSDGLPYIEGQGRSKGSFALAGITAANNSRFESRASEQQKALDRGAAEGAFVVLRGTQALDKLLRTRPNPSGAPSGNS